LKGRNLSVGGHQLEDLEKGEELARALKRGAAEKPGWTRLVVHVQRQSIATNQDFLQSLLRVSPAKKWAWLSNSDLSRFRFGILCYRLLPMEEQSLHSSEVLPAPRVMGRSLRIVVGAVLLYFFVELLRQTPQILAARSGWSIPRGTWWVGAIVCIVALPAIVNTGFGLRWGAWPQVIYVLLLCGAAIWDLLEYGSLWAPPLGSVILLLFLYVYGHAGVSFLIAGVAATPG